MEVPEAIRSRRSIRRFKQQPISHDVLCEAVDMARLAPSAANLQPLEFVVVDELDGCARLFNCLAWAGYVRPRRDPSPDQRPVSYVVVLVNTLICSSASAARDIGAAVENLILALAVEGIGSCWIGSINKAEIAEMLGVPDSLEVDSVVALGYPDEQPVVEEASDSIKYWLDEADVLHVPKRSLRGVLHRNGYGKV